MVYIPLAITLQNIVFVLIINDVYVIKSKRRDSREHLRLKKLPYEKFIFT
jgi:hypothetical protein